MKKQRKAVVILVANRMKRDNNRRGTRFLLQMLLSLLKVSYQAIAVLNGLAAVPRALGYYPVSQLLSQERMAQSSGEGRKQSSIISIKEALQRAIEC